MKKKKKKVLITGILQKHKKGFGFVIPEDESSDIFISTGSISGAMNGDKVLVELLPEEFWKNSREGYIKDIKERNTAEVVGTFQRNKKFGFVVSDDKRIKDDIFIDKKYFSGAQKGDKVVAKIIKYPNKNNSPEGKITQVISKFGQPGGDIKALIRQYNMFETFPSKAAAEANAVSKEEITQDLIDKRVDLRDKVTITIDGEYSKDFDDAVSLDILENGNYKLGVHIADVSHYIKEGNPLDKEALKRGNSVYLLDKVVPMLPKSLSNGICSLNPNEERLTMTCEMEINNSGKVVAHKIYESVIVSKERMTYKDVSDILENEDQDLIEKYNNIYLNLKDMETLSNILSARRDNRGSLDFDFDEANIILNDKGIPVQISIAERRTANRLIEEFMLLANQVVAEHFFLMEAPFVYRVHEKPSKEKVEELSTFLRGFGLVLKETPENVQPKTLNEILKKVSGQTYENVVNTIMLRSMQKAIYDVNCEGHFGLALKYYCHFTSPIRRYADLLIHRIIKEYLHRTVDAKRIKTLKKKTKEAAEIISTTERVAIDLERQVEKMKKAEYMTYHVGETYEGVISGVTNYGIYVELENTVEGMVRLEYMTDDYYDYDEKKYRVIGRRTNKIYGLGDKVMIKVHSVHLEEREINFILV